MNKYSTEVFAKRFYDEGERPLAWRAGMTDSEREVLRREIKEKVRSLMNFPDTVYEAPVVNLLCHKDRGSYFIEKYEISPEPSLWMTFLLLVPKTVSEDRKSPAVLCAPGTLWTKEALAGEDFWDLTYEPAQPPIGLAHRYYYANAMARHYVQNGIVALACEDFGVGEHKGTLSAAELGKLLYGQGRNMMSMTVEMRLSMLAFLRSLPYVDGNRVAVSGHSLGVDSLMHLAVLDGNIAAFVYNDFICDWKERISCICPPEIVPTNDWHMYSGVYRYYSYPDLLAALAPMPLFITEGGRTAYLETLKDAYKEVGAEDNFRYDYYPDYANASTRLHDADTLGMGMTHAEYFEHANVVPEKHFFKFEEAVPWLVSVLKP